MDRRHNLQWNLAGKRSHEFKEKFSDWRVQFLQNCTFLSVLGHQSIMHRQIFGLYVWFTVEHWIPWFCEYLQKQTKELKRAVTPLFDLKTTEKQDCNENNFYWMGNFYLAFSSTKKIRFPEKLDWRLQFQVSLHNSQKNQVKNNAFYGILSTT